MVTGMRRWVVRSVGVAALLAVVAGLIWFQWWRTHPDAFAETPGEVQMTAELEVGEQMYFGMTFPAESKPGTVTLHSAQPRIVEDTADSTVSLEVCSLIPPGMSAAGDADAGLVAVAGEPPPAPPAVPVISVKPEELHEFCLESSGVDDEPFRAVGDWTVPSQQILVLVSGAHSGSIEIDGIDLEYSNVNQHGSQTVGQHLVVEVG